MNTSLRMMVASVAVLLSFCAGSHRANAQTDGSVSVNYGYYGSMPSGKDGTVDLYAFATDPTGGYEGPTYTGPTWSWTATGASALSVDTSSSSQFPTLKVNVSPPGKYMVTVTATATWAVSTGGTVSASSSMQFELSIVGVEKLQFMAGASTYTDVAGVLYVPLNGSLGFQAIPNSGESMFPMGEPVWSGSSGVAGTGSMTSVTFTSLSASPSDFKTVIASCGDTSVTANVIVYDASVPFPVIVTMADTTFSPEFHEPGTSVTATLTAKATRPTPQYPATLMSHMWDCQAICMKYSQESPTGPWNDGSMTGAYAMMSITGESSDSTHNYATFSVMGYFPVPGHWEVGCRARIDYTDSFFCCHRGQVVAVVRCVPFVVDNIVVDGTNNAGPLISLANETVTLKLLTTPPNVCAQWYLSSNGGAWSATPPGLWNTSGYTFGAGYYTMSAGGKSFTLFVSGKPNSTLFGNEFKDWSNAVIGGKDNMANVLGQYKTDGSTLLPTVMNQVFVGSAAMEAYFKVFLKKQGKDREGNKLNGPVGTLLPEAFLELEDTDLAVFAGRYKFDLGEGPGNEKKYRFTYVYKKVTDPLKWEILHHHSSALPSNAFYDAEAKTHPNGAAQVPPVGALKTIMEAWQKAVNDAGKDPENAVKLGKIHELYNFSKAKILPLYKSEGGVALDCNELIAGEANIKKYYDKIFVGVHKTEVTKFDIQFSEVTGKVGVNAGILSFKRNGECTERRARFTFVVWNSAATGDPPNWKIIHHHMSNLPLETNTNLTAE